MSSKNTHKGVNELKPIVTVRKKDVKDAIINNIIPTIFLNGLELSEMMEFEKKFSFKAMPDLMLVLLMQQSSRHHDQFLIST